MLLRVNVYDLAIIGGGTFFGIGDCEIAEEVGLCTTSGSDYPISMLNMKELDALMYVKLI